MGRAASDGLFSDGSKTELVICVLLIKTKVVDCTVKVIVFFTDTSLPKSSWPYEVLFRFPLMSADIIGAR